MSERQPGGWSGLAKFAVGSAMLVVLSLGLCGLSFNNGGLGGGLAIVGLLGFLAGGLGLGVSALIATVMALSEKPTQLKIPPPDVRQADPPAPPKDDNQIRKDESQE